MSTPLGERAGVIVVRAWLESDGRVRARVTSTDLSMTQENKSASAEGVDEIVRTIRDWLERFAESSPS
jgi:hypothetical protein